MVKLEPEVACKLAAQQVLLPLGHGAAGCREAKSQGPSGDSRLCIRREPRRPLANRVASGGHTWPGITRIVVAKFRGERNTSYGK